MKVKSKGWFLPIQNIEDIFISRTDGKRYEMSVTIFFFDHNMRDKEITFTQILN